MMFQKEYFGIGSISNLKNILLENQAKRIFLVRGKRSHEISGAGKVLDSLLKKYEQVDFYDFEANPKIEDIKKGISKIKIFDPDVVIAVGGGSVIDMAKSINILSAQDDDSEKYIKKEKDILNQGKKLIAIPTTAGSGSEATHFAVVYINKTKYSLKHEYILPDYTILDPQFTFSLPNKIAASTGMDALSQAVESYWCVNSNEESKKYAAEAIKLIMFNLSKAVNKGDSQAKEAMSKAANLAGKAINITQTTACHAISYPITSYFNVPHGHAAALTLGSMLVYNNNVTEEDIMDKRGVDYAKKIMRELIEILGGIDEDGVKRIINSLMIDIGLETKLSSIGIDDQGLEIIIREGFNPDRVKNNLRLLNEKNLRKILNDIR